MYVQAVIARGEPKDATVSAKGLMKRLVMDDDGGDEDNKGNTGDDGGGGDEKDPVTSKDLMEVRLHFISKRGQRYNAFGDLDVVPEWADKDLITIVQIYRRGSAPLHRNLYETAVAMSLDRKGMETHKV